MPIQCPESGAPGRPCTGQAIRALVLEMAHDNPGWGYRRIHDELTTPRNRIAPLTVWQILKDAGIDPVAAGTHEELARAHLRHIVTLGAFQELRDYRNNFPATPGGP